VRHPLHLSHPAGGLDVTRVTSLPAGMT